MATEADTTSVSGTADVKQEVKEEITTVSTNGTVENGEKSVQVDDAGEEPKPPCDGYTVFVARLPAMVNINEMKAHFKSAGNILSVDMPGRLVKKSNRQSIAFVKFATQKAYEGALKLDGSKMGGQAILVLPLNKTHEGLLKIGEESKKALQDRTPVYKKSEHVAYVKNLPFGVSEDVVLNFFDLKREDVVDISVAPPQVWFRRPLRAVIAVKTEEDLQRLIGMSNKKFKNQEVSVEKHHMASWAGKRPAGDNINCEAAPSKRAKTSETSGNTGDISLDIYVKHIPREASEEQIKDFFNCAGALVQKVNLFSRVLTGPVRAVGFITMADKDSVQKALLMDNMRFFKGKVQITLRRGRNFHEGEGNPAVNTFAAFISNLPLNEQPETVKEALLKHFEKTDCKIKIVNVPEPRNQSGNKGYAFIVLKDEDSLKKVQNMTDKEIVVSGKKCTFAVSDNWPENPIKPVTVPQNSADTSRNNRQQTGWRPPLFTNPPRNLIGMNQNRWRFPNQGPPVPFGPGYSRNYSGNFSHDFQDQPAQFQFSPYRDCFMMRDPDDQREEDFPRFRNTEVTVVLPRQQVPIAMDRGRNGRRSFRMEGNFRIPEGYPDEFRGRHGRRVIIRRRQDSSEFGNGFANGGMAAQGSGAYPGPSRRGSDIYDDSAFTSPNSGHYMTANESTFALLDSSYGHESPEGATSFREADHGNFRNVFFFGDDSRRSSHLSANYPQRRAFGYSTFDYDGWGRNGSGGTDW